MSEWISVEDRLPPNIRKKNPFQATPYLVTDGREIALVDWLEGGVPKSWQEWSSHGEVAAHNITHWMPMPNLPGQ